MVKKKIDGVKEDYYIGTDGNVYNSKDKIVRCYKKDFDNWGHPRIKLTNKYTKKKKFFYIKKLVADAFIPNDFQRKSLYHLDKNFENNSVDNLCWHNPGVQDLAIKSLSEFKKIIGLENYGIHPSGFLINLDNPTEKIKTYISKEGYRYACINNKYLYIHRLVALAFCYNPDKKKYTVVNHRDENKLNNRKENLEWVSQKYNLAYSKRRRALGIEKGTIPDKAYGEGEIL